MTIFQNDRPKYTSVNISASIPLRNLILVSKHTFLKIKIVIKRISNMYLQDLWEQIRICGLKLQSVETDILIYGHTLQKFFYFQMSF